MLNLTPPVLIARLIVLVVAFTIHELAHAWTADRFGDDLPRLQGRLTLNPLVHLDPLGSILLLATGFGWARPVQVSPYVLQRRSSAAPMLVALAGPVSNLLLAIIAALPVQLGLVVPTFVTGNIIPTAFQLISEFVFINLLLMLFNLIPIAPLDGEKVLFYFLPPSGQDFMLQIRPYGPMILLVLIFIAPLVGLNILSLILGVPLNLLYGLLLG
jgi:Zn-dependent protease